MKVPAFCQYSPKKYPIEIRNTFHIKAPIEVQSTNTATFIPASPAGIDIYVRAIGNTLAIKTDCLPYLLKTLSALSIPFLLRGIYYINAFL